MENRKVMPRFQYHTNPDTGEKCCYSNSYSQRSFEDALKYQAEAGDVFICSFVKSGTTWLQYIVWLILHGGDDFPPGVSMRQAIPELEFDGYLAVEAITDTPRMIKCHFEHKLVPRHPDAKYLYIARNPKDVIVSYLYHLRGFKEYEAADLQMEGLFELFAYGEVEFGNWFQHVADWYAQHRRPNVLFLLYEDLKRSPEEEILKIAAFLGEDFRDALMRDDRRLLRVVLQRTDIQSMKKEKDSKWVPSTRFENCPFIRKGVIGDHKNHLTSEQITILNRLLEEQGSASGINRLWDQFSELA